jgi:hypothetical protein
MPLRRYTLDAASRYAIDPEFDDRIRFDKMLAEWRARNASRVTCAGCRAVELLDPFALDMVRSQIRLWRAGWRRDVATQLDYCPTCEAHRAA